MFAFVSAGADKKANTSGAAAHSRLVIFVSLRMAASAAAPSAPMPLPPRLRARVGMGMVRELECQWALTRKQTFSGGGSLQMGDLRLVEDGSQRSGALGFDAVVFETASEG